MLHHKQTRKDILINMSEESSKKIQKRSSKVVRWNEQMASHRSTLNRAVRGVGVVKLCTCTLEV